MREDPVEGRAESRRFTHFEAGSMSLCRTTRAGTKLEGSLVREPNAVHIHLIVPDRYASAMWYVSGKQTGLCTLDPTAGTSLKNCTTLPVRER